MSKFSTSIYKLIIKDLKNNDFKLSQLRGKVALIVNVASKCGYTPQYEGLQRLHDKYGGKGLMILGFPCNQFGQQEPADAKGIERFLMERFQGIHFPLMQKSDVNGPEANEVYKLLKKEVADKIGVEEMDIQWNFEKFLLNREGDLVEHFSSKVAPEQIEKDIVKLL